MMEAFKDPGLAEHMQRCQARRAADRIGRQRATQKTISAAAFLLRISQLQDLPFAHYRGDGIAAADYFAVTGQVGGDAITLLRAAPGQAKAGDNLIENQHDGELAGDVPQAFEEAGL